MSAARLATMRARIVEAAASCLAELGVDGATTRAVAERAGVANGLLYRYFPTKEALFAAVAEHQAATRTPELLAGVSPHDWVGALRSVAASLFDGKARATSALPGLRARAITDTDIRVALRRYDRAVVRQGAALLETAAAAGELSSTDPEATVEAIQALFEGVQARLAARSVTTDPRRLAHAAAALVMGLAGERR